MGDATIPTAARLWLDSGYDHRSRRISKVVSNWTGSAWAFASNTRFAYDGWNLIAEVNGTNNAVIRSYMWGVDLGGTMQGAGGVGGLLAINAGTNGVHFTAYDANGNIVALVNATNGTASARFDYGPFGEAIRADGTAAASCPMRLSTKYEDIETDFVYYGYRYYRLTTTRWLNRDPLEEKGGLNTYSRFRIQLQ